MIKAALKLLYFAAIVAKSRVAESGIISTIPGKSYIKEYCTIKIGTARQSGHTTAIIDFIEQEKEHLGKILILVPNSNMQQLIRGKTSTDIEINTFNYITSEAVVADTIFVDCASFLSKSKQDELVADMARSNKHKKFLFLVE